VETPRIEVVNLTNGLYCPHLDNKHPAYPIGNYRYSRIQSTHCEMKQWDEMVNTSFGPDLWLHLAMGHHLVVHDYSERPWKKDPAIRRETRACWQGVNFIRYVAERCWGMPITPSYGRNSQWEMTEYFEEAWYTLKSTTTHRVKYYNKHRNAVTPPKIQLTSCWREDGQYDCTRGAGWQGCAP
jgi:hypothetical protein